MKVGDKVRILKDTIEGVVIRVIDDKQVEIEDDFGFGMPVLISDLVLVSPLEDRYFKNKEENFTGKTLTETKVATRVATKGLYLGVVEEHKNYALYVSNNTSVKHFLTVYSKKGEDSKNLYFDVLNSKASTRIGLYPLSEIDSWNSVFIGFQSKSPEITQFFQVAKKINLAKLKKSPQDIPLIASKGICIQLDNEIELDKSSLEIVINNPLEKESASIKDLKKPKSEIDLHAEYLGINEEEESHVILAEQLRVFERALESAIAFNMSDITFIHGIGNGKLRTEIHKRIKNYSGVKYFEDANQTRFGFGATKVVLN